MRMRFLVISVLVFWAMWLSSCKNNSENVNPDMLHFPDPESVDLSELPAISFEDTLFDFGTIIEGEQVEASFSFTNTGNEALVLTRVEPSCGCTVTKDWPKSPIKPGESGTIKAVFDSNGRAGSQKKIITVIGNMYPSSRILYINGTVIGPDNK